MALYPTDRRDYSSLAQGEYFKAISEIRQIHSCTSPEAVARLDKHITAYVAGKGEFCLGFLKYLDTKPWKVAEKPKDDPAKQREDDLVLERKLVEEGKARRAARKAAQV